MEPDLLERAVLDKLIFDESYENLLMECRSLAKPNVLTDVLKLLIQHKLVVAKPVQDGERAKPGFMYDSDHMHDYTYRATAKGVKFLQMEG